MGKVNAHWHHFTTGEFSAAGLARIDQEAARLAAEVQENLFPHAIGKGQVRPGTQYLGATPSSVQARLLPFTRAVDDVALLVLTNAALRVLVDDEYVTRPSVTSSVTNGDFSSGTGWTLTASSGASSAVTGGKLVMDAVARGSNAFAERAVTTSNAGTEHALDIIVDRGPVRFRCGSTSGAQDYITETTLDTGYHSLAFTPSGTFYPRFITRNGRDCIIDSIQVASAGVMSIAAPWTTAQLRSIRFDQSADVIFLACKDWQQRKIERRGARSWSVAIYESDDGPFDLGNDTISLTAALTVGNTTIAADSPVFSSDMVGSLVRLQHDRFDTTVQLAGQGVYSDVFVLRGIVASNFNDRSFAYQVTGTWAGTARMQKSLTGPEGDFLDWNYDDSVTTAQFTTNVSPTHTGSTGENNVVSYIRIGFIDGAYTSGVLNLAIQYDGFSGNGIGRITAVNSATEVDIEVLDDFNADTATRAWDIGSWSDNRGWPSAVAFFDGRLWWGGLDDFWGSVSDNFYSFDDTVDGDSGPIVRKVATGGQVSRVNGFLPLQRLIVLTTGAEVSIRSSSFDEPLTPTNITLKDASTVGSASVSPVKVDSQGVFVHRSNRRVYSAYYSIEANDYISKDLTRLNEDIASEGILELSVQREPETYVWCVRGDGQVAILIYDIEEKVEGWSRFITDGEVESVCVLPGEGEDVVYLAVKRTINGSDVRYIEKVCMHSEALGGSTNRMADSGVYAAGPVSSVTAAHLANETGLVGWGTKSGTPQPITGLSADGSGVIALGDTYTEVFVGLPYDWRYKSSRLAYGAQGGTALLMRKRVSQLGLLVNDTHRDAIRFGPDFTTMRKMDLTKNGQAVAANTVFTTAYDADPFGFPGEWSTDARVCLKGSAPYPASLLALVIGVETNEK
jgi:hypothetical protein